MNIDYEHHLKEFLAIIHRDGGHYLSEHGWDKAIKDAKAKLTQQHIGPTMITGCLNCGKQVKMQMRSTEVCDYLLKTWNV